MEENADKIAGTEYSPQMVQTIHDGAQFVNMRRKNCFERLSGKGQTKEMLGM